MRLDDVNARMASAAARAGRDASEITLIGVTKTVPTSKAEEFLQNGGAHLGENRTQELLAKRDHLGSLGLMPTWHMIGRLQTNKVRDIVGKVSLIHSVDSEKLGREISKTAASLGIVQDVLVQVNISGEAQKGGVPPEYTAEFTAILQAMPNIQPLGLMVVPPAVEAPEENRYFFRKTNELLIDIRASLKDNGLSILSMGMSGDFEVAIEEGATMIRLGSTLFGERDYK